MLQSRMPYLQQESIDGENHDNFLLRMRILGQTALMMPHLFGHHVHKEPRSMVPPQSLGPRIVSL